MHPAWGGCEKPNRVRGGGSRPSQYAMRFAKVHFSFRFCTVGVCVKACGDWCTQLTGRPGSLGRLRYGWTEVRYQTANAV
jgi:hypothetical protein